MNDWIANQKSNLWLKSRNKEKFKSNQNPEFEDSIEKQTMTLKIEFKRKQLIITHRIIDENLKSLTNEL